MKKVTLTLLVLVVLGITFSCQPIEKETEGTPEFGLQEKIIQPDDSLKIQPDSLKKKKIRGSTILGLDTW